MVNVFRSKKGWISVIAVASVPLLYSAAYLAAFWNPYGHLESIPVALVNHDPGQITHDEIQELSKEIHIKEATSQEARQWLENGKVGLVIMQSPPFHPRLANSVSAVISRKPVVRKTIPRESLGSVMTD